MADYEGEFTKRLVEITTRVIGAKVSADDLRAVEAQQRDLVRSSASATQAGTVFGKSLTNTGAQAKNTSGILGKLRSDIDDVTAGFKVSIGTIAGFGAALGGSSIGLISSVRYLEDYNKKLLVVSGSWAKYGVGTKTFEMRMKNISNATELTQKDTLGLLGTYEKTFNNVSLNNATKLFKNLRGAVGSNSEAMGELLGTLSQVVSKFPELEASITNMTAADKSRLTSINEALVLTGQMSLAEAKRFQDYLAQNEQARKADEERKNEMKSQVDAIQDIKRVFEQVSLVLSMSGVAERRMQAVNLDGDRVENLLLGCNDRRVFFAVTVRINLPLFPIGHDLCRVLRSGLTIVGPNDVLNGLKRLRHAGFQVGHAKQVCVFPLLHLGRTQIGGVLSADGVELERKIVQR